MSEAIKEKAKETVSVASKISNTKKVNIPERIENISLKWLRDAPFFSEFLLRFNYYITTDVPTMGVNSKKGRINLYINEEFMNGGGQRIKTENGEAVFVKDENDQPVLDKNGEIQYEMVDWEGLNDNQLEAVLVHEIMHLVRLHHERIGEKSPYIWNISADMLINDDIKDMKVGNRKIILPEGAVYLDMAKDDGYEGEPITEPLYDWLIDKQEEFMNMMQDLVNDPSGDGKCPMCGGSGTVKDDKGEKTCPMCGGSGKNQNKGMFDAKYGSKIDDHSKLEESDGLSESTIKEVIDTAKVRGWGNISGDMVSKLEKLIQPARINWKQHLRKALAAHVFSHGSMYENNWSRRNRRQLPLPGVKKLSNRAIIGVDTSGSISQVEFEQFFAEIEKICKDGSMLTIVQWDTEIQDVWKEYNKGDWKRIKIKGHGGTNVQNMFDWMVENKRNKDLLIMFTDGYFSYDYDTHCVKTLWCVTGEGNDPPGGKRIFVEIEDK